MWREVGLGFKSQYLLRTDGHLSEVPITKRRPFFLQFLTGMARMLGEFHTSVSQILTHTDKRLWRVGILLPPIAITLHGGIEFDGTIATTLGLGTEPVFYGLAIQTTTLTLVDNEVGCGLLLLTRRLTAWSRLTERTPTGQLTFLGLLVGWGHKHLQRQRCQFINQWVVDHTP